MRDWLIDCGMVIQDVRFTPSIESRYWVLTERALHGKTVGKSHPVIPDEGRLLIAGCADE